MAPFLRTGELPPNLESLDLRGNPCCSRKGYPDEIIQALPHLEVCLCVVFLPYISIG